MSTLVSPTTGDKDSGRAMATKSEIGRNISKILNINVFSFEYAVVLDLYECGAASSGDLKSRSIAGGTVFYHTIRNLLASGIIVAGGDAVDGRRRVYRLSSWAREILDEEFSFLLDWYKPDPLNGDKAGDSLTTFIRNTKERLKIRFFSCEYQIILMVYEFEPCTTGDLLQMCGVSNTTFFSALRKLAGRGLIQAEADGGDHRIKKYRLPLWVREAQDQLRHELQQWAKQTLACG